MGKGAGRPTPAESGLGFPRPAQSGPQPAAPPELDPRRPPLVAVGGAVPLPTARGGWAPRAGALPAPPEVTVPPLVTWRGDRGGDCGGLRVSAGRGVLGLGSGPGGRPDLWNPSFEQEAGPGTGSRAASGAGSATSVRSLYVTLGTEKCRQQLFPS